MKSIKRALAAVLCAAMVITLAPSGSADAAKKPKLKKKASVTVGQTVKIKVKNAKKSSKFTWKTSNKKVAKISKKIAKGKKASATVKGVKVGKANITATYKNGSKKTKLKCKVTVTADSGAKPSVNPTAAATTPAQTQTTPPAGQSTDQPSPTATNTPTKRPTASPTPKPTATPVPSPDTVIYKTYVDINVDGEVDDTWDFADEMEINNWAVADEDKGTQQTTNAKAKMLWTESKLYILVTADDPEIDLANEATYRQDSVEIFFDENNSKVDYDKCNAFQYRLVINPDADAENPAGTLTDKNYWDGEDIVSAVKTTDTGYVCEFAIPLKEAPVARNFAGVEIQINDASAGQRNGTLNLFANPTAGDAIPYDSTTVFGDCQYMIKTQPKVITLNLTEDNLDMRLPDQFRVIKTDDDGNQVLDEDGNPVYETDADGNYIPQDGVMNTLSKLENGELYCNTANNAVVYFSDGTEERTVLNGETAKVKIIGTYVAGEEEDTSATAFRMWMVDSNGRTLTGDSPVTTSNQETISVDQLNPGADGSFEYELEFTAREGDKPADDGYESAGNCDGIMIKAPTFNSTIGNLVIKSIVITVEDPIRNDKPSTGDDDSDEPSADTYVADLTNTDSYVFDGGNTTASYNAETGTLDVSVAQFQAILFKAPADKTYKYVEITYTSDSDLNYYLFDSKLTDGLGQTPDGQHQVDNLAAAATDAVVVYVAGEGYEGNCVTGIKLVHVDFGSSAAKNIHIKSVKFMT